MAPRAYTKYSGTLPPTTQFRQDELTGTRSKRPAKAADASLFEGEGETQVSQYDVIDSEIGGGEELENSYGLQPSITAKNVVTAERVVEHYSGRLDRIENDTAFVSLKSPQGDELFAECRADEFRSKGIVIGEAFDCDTIDTGEGVRVQISKRHRVPLTTEMVGRLRSELAKGLAGLE